MATRRPWPLAVCCAALGCSAAAPPPSQALAEAKNRCSIGTPERNRDEALDPLSTASPAGGRMNPELSALRGFFAVNRPPASPREGESYPVELRLRAREVISPGQHLGVELTFVNRSRGPVTLLQALATEGDEKRHPYYDLYVRREGSGQAYEFGFGKIDCFCDAAPPPIRPSDYIDLGPGAAARPDIVRVLHLDEARLLSPGRYVLWAVYRFCGFGPHDHASSFDGTSDTHWFDVLHGEYVSNPVSVEVR